MIRSTLVLFIGLILITVWGCSEDGENNPTTFSNPGDQDVLIDISGITETGIAGEISHNDPDDWCVPAKTVNEGGLPTEFAFYPAYPNPSYQQVLIHYDLPAPVIVNIGVVDIKGNLVRTLENGDQPAGVYVTSWDRTDEEGNEVDTGLYRVIMEAGDFVCHGDLKLAGLNRPSPGTLRLTATASDSILTVTFDSPISVGGIVFILSYEGTLGTVIYGSAAHKLSKYSDISDQTIRISILPGVTGGSMAAGQHRLCAISIDGSAALRYVDAADYLGDVMKTMIVNSP